MNNSNNIKAPSISTVDPDGVQWTYDPTARKWMAIASGKKFSSKDYSTVAEKVKAHLLVDATKVDDNKKVVEAQAPVLMEIGLLSVKNSDGGMGSRGLNPLRGGLKMEPVIVKVEWDKANNDIKIVRYKETEKKDSGWKSWQADNMILVHPKFLTGEMRKLVKKSFEGRAMQRAFSNAEKQVAQAWWGAKDEDRSCWRLGRNGFENEQRSTYDRHTTNSGMVAQSWPLTVSGDPSTLDFSDWKTNDDGSLTKGEVVVRMERGTTGYRTKDLVFNVYLPGSDTPAFSDGDFRTVLLMGNASVEMLNNGVEESIVTWNGKNEWEQDPGHNSWPSKMEVRAAAIVPKYDPYRSSSSATSYFYGRVCGAALSNGPTPSKLNYERDDNTVMGWHEVPMGYGAVSLRAAGPEDAALAEVKALKERFQALPSKHDLLPISGDAMSEIFEHTLIDIYNAIMDGEEVDKDPAAAKTIMANLMHKMEQSVLTSDSVAAWTKDCQEVAQSTCEAISGAAPKPKSRKPK